ncbi:MAG: UDP-glucose/GDP-mannose dehydrogenase family protein [Candidatus Protochlamydia sp.]|nr:UDP-glucose/GDP-mannose dehydrogenase family protein [Candidatus Protochlamydia sp.]
MKLTIYGCGYVGLITGLCFAKLGHEVLGYDNNQGKINSLKNGIPVIGEEHFDELFNEVKHKIKFSSKIKEATAFSNIHIISVGTPSYEDDTPNLSHLDLVVENLIDYIYRPSLFIIRSTVPIGKTISIKKKIEDGFSKKGIKIPFNIAFLPEFFAEGTAINDFMNSNRIIVGVENDIAFETIKAIYHPLVENKTIPIIRMSINSAELTKYASNAFLATKISFINAISRIAESHDADINEVAEGMSYDKRIGPTARAGCGFGGSCLDKDLHALILLSQHDECTTRFLKSILSVNDSQKLILFHKLKKIFRHDLKDKTIAIWGLSFKPHTDDIREASSCTLIDSLLITGVKMQAYDPVANKNIQDKYPHLSNLMICETKEKALEGADALVIVTEWEEFQSLEPHFFLTHMKEPIIVDGRNVYNPQIMLEHGIAYYGIGRRFSL